MDISKLTDEEIAWYAERDWVLEILGNYSCGLCQYRDQDDLLCIFRECPKFNDDYKDAAEFEARVAKEVINLNTYNNGCILPIDCPDMLCTACILKYARIYVEAEMEKETANKHI